MRFELDLDVDAPPAEVWRVFNDPANLPYWQPTLQSYEALSGEPGWPGAISLLVYHEKGRRIEMTGVIHEREEGRYLAGHYENAWSVNEMACTFAPLPSGGTRWHAVVEYRLKGWAQVLSLMLRNGIRKRLLDDMLRFKQLVESGDYEPAYLPARSRNGISRNSPRH